MFKLCLPQHTVNKLSGNDLNILHFKYNKCFDFTQLVILRKSESNSYFLFYYPRRESWQRKTSQSLIINRNSLVSQKNVEQISQFLHLDEDLDDEM